MHKEEDFHTKPCQHVTSEYARLEPRLAVALASSKRITFKFVLTGLSSPKHKENLHNPFYLHK